MRKSGCIPSLALLTVCIDVQSRSCFSAALASRIVADLEHEAYDMGKASVVLRHGLEFGLHPSDEVECDIAGNCRPSKFQ